MNKAISFLVLIVLLAIPVSSTIYSTDPRIINLFRFEDTGTQYNDTINSSAFLIPYNSSVTAEQLPLSPNGSYSIKVDESSWLWGNQKGRYLLPSPITGNLTVLAWINITTIRDNAYMFATRSATGGWSILFDDNAAADNRFNYMEDEEDASAYGWAIPPLNEKIVIGGRYNGTHICAIYMNRTNSTHPLKNCVAHSTGLSLPTNPLQVGAWNNASLNGDWTFYIDDLVAFNASLDQSNLTDLWNNGILHEEIINDNLKLTFYDEMTGAEISSETYTIYLDKPGFSQTYTTTNNPYEILNLDTGIYNLKASSTNYPERNYFDISVVNTTRTNLSVYLINTSDGEEKTFSVTDAGINPLEDGSIVFTRTINGTDVVIVEEETDYSGNAKLYLDSDYEYTINFSKSGYDDKVINLEPEDSTYSISLVSETEKNVTLARGITYRLLPYDTLLNNNTYYTFSFTLTSSYWAVTNCTLTLKNGSQTLNESSSHTANSCYINIQQYTDNLTNLTSEARYEINSEYNITITKQYSVIYTYEGEFSLKNFIDDLTTFSRAGFDNFGRMMIAMIVILVITILAARNLGFTNPESLIPLVWSLVLFFSYINWFYLDYATLPDITGLRKYIIFILVSLIALAFFIDKYAR